jgi:P27 family predicted phage terminase small subunit
VANPAVPIERKRRRGNPGKRRLPEPAASLVPAGLPAAPDSLEDTGRGLWELVWRDGSQWLSTADTVLVALLCESADERERWLQLVAEQGPTFQTEKGYVGIHPGVSQVRLIGKEIVAMLGLLGFTPSDRARLGLAEVRRMTHLSELMERRKADIGR